MQPTLDRARESIVRWGFKDAERLLAVARDGGAEPEHLAQVTRALSAAREAEKAACIQLDKGHNRELLTLEGLAQAEALLKEHPDSCQLRLLAAQFSGVLGRFADGLAHADKAVGLHDEQGQMQVMLRQFLEHTAKIAARDPWIEEPPFAEWRPVNGGQWRIEGPRQFRGRLMGMAQFGFAGLVNKAAGVLQAPYEVRVELELDTTQPAAYGGIILGLRDANNCLLVYLLHDTRIKDRLKHDPEKLKRFVELRGFAGDRALRYARWRNDRWEQIGDDIAVEFENSGGTRLSVTVGHGELAATVNGKTIQAVELSDPLDGRVGVLKWYDNVVGFRNFEWLKR